MCLTLQHASSRLPQLPKDGFMNAKWSQCLVSAPEERENGSFRHNISFMVALLLLPCAAAPLQTPAWPSQGHSTQPAPLCLSQEPAEELKGPGFVFYLSSVTVESLPRGRDTWSSQQGGPSGLLWVLCPVLWKKAPQLQLTSFTFTLLPLGAIDMALRSVNDDSKCPFSASLMHSPCVLLLLRQHLMLTFCSLTTFCFVVDIWWHTCLLFACWHQ